VGQQGPHTILLYPLTPGLALVAIVDANDTRGKPWCDTQMGALPVVGAALAMAQNTARSMRTMLCMNRRWKRSAMRVGQARNATAK